MNEFLDFDFLSKNIFFLNLIKETSIHTVIAVALLLVNMLPRCTARLTLFLQESLLLQKIKLALPNAFKTILFPYAAHF